MSNAIARRPLMAGKCYRMKSNPITWTNEKRKLSDLIPWEINPATIDKAEAKRLEESLAEFGQVETIAISPTNEIYDGHQRQTVWSASAKFGKDYEVDVRVSSRPLTERERKKLVIFLRKGAVGHIDFDMLANHWEIDDLLEWGFNEAELGIVPNFEPVGIEEQGRLDEKKKVTCPECGHEFTPK